MPLLARTIQYYGLLRPPENFSRAKYYDLHFELVRRPTQPYTNKKYPSNKGLFGYLQTFAEGRVLETVALEYEEQVCIRRINDSYFLHACISCHLEAMLTSFINVANYLQPGFVIQRNNPIKDWSPSFADFDEIKVRFLDERTVGRLILDFEEIDTCDVLGAEPPPLKKPNLPKRPDIPFPADIPNTSIPPISPPYEGIDDNGETYNPDELPPEPPEGTQPCLLYRLEVEFLTRSFNSQTNIWETSGLFQTGGNYFGPIVRLVTDNSLPRPSIKVECRGDNPVQGCQPGLGLYLVYDTEPQSQFTAFQFVNLRITKLELIEAQN